ncbi:hypothetical protein [Polaribacter sp.]
MNESLKFGVKVLTALFALGAGAKLGQDAIEHGKKINNKKKENKDGK